MALTVTPLSVGRLVDLLQETIEDNFMQVAVEGEISNLARPASGHLYLTLKDKSAQIRAVMFRGAARLLKFRPEDGQQVICRGRVTVYKQRGEMQFVIDALDAVGTGNLQIAFEQLKATLAAEGLFAEERKQPLPAYPTTVGIVTSGTGAAIHDMLKAFRRNSAGVRVILRPVRVQGDSAAGEIAAAIADLNVQGESDVLIVGRGGGSLEDLWAFNEVTVARAVAASDIPVISAVGHEVDVTIADYVADFRAATPTAAAEQIVRSRHELENHLDRLRLRLATQLDGRIGLLREKVATLRHRLISPSMQLALWRQRFQSLTHRLQQAVGLRLRDNSDRLGALSGRLDALSPLKTLQRGYAIALREVDVPVYDAAELAIGERLRLQFAKGQAVVRVKEIES